PNLTALIIATPPTDFYTLSLHDALPISKRQLLPFLVELALDTQPFLPQSAAGQAKCKHPEWLGGFPDQIRRAGRKQRSGSKIRRDRKSTRLNSSHVSISYAVFCLKKKKK